MTATTTSVTDSAAVHTDAVWKIFEQEPADVAAVQGITITIEPSEFVAMAGPNMSNRALARMRLERIGFVFQAYNLLPVLTALENAEFPLLLLGVEEDERRHRVDELFDRTGLSGLEDRRPGKLSGGQQQRVAVIRAVASQPALVLADEPTANLDSQTSDGLLDMMEELNRELGTTFLFATHDPRVMERARRLIRLVDGAVASDERRRPEPQR
jgi:putative ABC transport system ATP-binding protein